MSREILFRGKRIKTGEWGYGDLIHAKSKTFVGGEEEDIFWMEAEVDPATVGQFTGHFSKEKAKVFEGDILKDLSETAPSYKNAVYVVIWDKENASFALNYYDTLGYKNVPHKLIETSGFKDVFELKEWATIIGNIHDNPELLKEEAE